MGRPKVREHNEHFQTVNLGGRKSCPTCYVKKAGQLYWWFEYVRVRRNTVKHFCAACYGKEVRDKLLEHAGPCGCTITLVWHGDGPRPDWLTLEESDAQCGRELVRAG